MTYPKQHLVVGFDNLDKSRLRRRAHHNGLLRRKELANAEKRIRMEPENLQMAGNYANLLYECEGFDAALQFSQMMLQRRPESAQAYLVRARLLAREAQLRFDYTDFSDEILRLGHQVLSKISTNDDNYGEYYEQAWVAICIAYAATGRHNEFTTAVQKLCEKPSPLGNDHNVYVVHRCMAEYFERASDWRNAIIEWRKALQYCEEPYVDGVESALQFCQEQA